MASIGNITVFDGETTPATHTYTGIMVKNVNGRQIALYRDSSNTSVPIEAQPTIELSQETLKSGVMKFVARVALPVMESVAGQNSAGYTSPPKVAHVVTSEMTVYAHPRSTTQQRRNARQILANIVTGLSTTVAVVTSAPVSELVDAGISPT